MPLPQALAFLWLFLSALQGSGVSAECRWATAPPPQVQVPGVLVDVSQGTVAVRNLRLQGGRLAAVHLLPASGQAPPRTCSRTRTATSTAQLQVDWEQRYDPGNGSYSLVAQLPRQYSTVGQVLLYCQGCHMPSHPQGSYTGPLGNFTCLTPEQVAESSTLVFTLQALVLQGKGMVPSEVAVGQGQSAGNATHHTNTMPDPAGSSPRRLQQQQQQQHSPAAPSPEAGPTSCTLQIGSQQISYEGCQQLPMQPTLLYHVFYTLRPSASGNSSVTQWRGGMKVDVAAVQGQCVGFGFPKQPATMIGADAVVVKECASCPSGAEVVGMHLADYVPEANIPGSFPITDTLAAKGSDGTLVAAFTAEVPKPLEDLLKAPFNAIFAIGLLAPDGSMLPHPPTGRPYGGTRLRLSAGSALTPAAESSPGAGTPPAPATAENGQGTQPGMPPSALSPAPAAEVALSGTSSNTTCRLTIEGSRSDFAACTPVPGIGTAYTLMWTLESQGGSMRQLTLGLQAASGGWVAVGFPANPGRMVGATAMILKTCTSCRSGAQIQDYFLAAMAVSGVQPPGRLPVSDPAAAATPDGTMQGTIKVQLPADAARNPSFPLIAAAGPLGSSEGLLQHLDRGALTVNLESGTSGGVEGEPSHIRHLKNAHGWLMAVGWGVLIPTGILIARHGKRWDPLWFQAHRAIQMLGLSCGLTGFVIIFAAVKQATGSSVSVYTVHRRLGISAMSLGFFQLTALVYRPHKGTRLRPYWEFVHHWVGRAAAVVAVANIYEGILNVRRLGAWAVATYSVVFGLIVVLGVGLDIYKLLFGRCKPALMQGGALAHEGSTATATAASSGKSHSEPGTGSSGSAAQESSDDVVGPSHKSLSKAAATGSELKEVDV